MSAPVDLVFVLAAIPIAAAVGFWKGKRVGYQRALPPAMSVLSALPPPDDERWEAKGAKPCAVKCKQKVHWAYELGNVSVFVGCCVKIDGIAICGKGKAIAAYCETVRTVQQQRRALEAWS